MPIVINAVLAVSSLLAFAAFGAIAVVMATVLGSVL
jgi:hypothetical protein